MIRSSKHTLKFTNVTKRQQIQQLISDYQEMVRKYVNVLWNEQESKKSYLGGYEYKKITTDRKNDSKLRQCASKQACSMVKSVLSKHHKRLFKLAELQKKNHNTAYLQRKISLTNISKPKTENISVELDPRFVDIKVTNNHFNLFIQIDEIGDKIKIRIPVKHSRVSKRWLNEGRMLHSIRLKLDSITLYFDIPLPEKSGTRKVGADQGQLTCLSLSDGQVTKKNKDGYDLNVIQDILSRRKKGSKGFKRGQEHRKNYINWSLNQLNFGNIKEVGLEKLVNLRKGKKYNRKSSHWTYSLIKNKLVMLSETEGFTLVEQDNKFKSQRCSSCGFTHKSNRLGKTFKCLHCGFTTDSDLNAASNHEVELFELPIRVWNSHINRKNGFFWFSDCWHESIVRAVI